MKLRMLAAMILFLLATAAVSHAERVFLKNGDVITGKTVSSTSDVVVVETEQGKVEIPKEKIERIEYDDDPATQYRDRNGSIIWRPLPTVVAAIAGAAEIVVEAQTAFSRHFAVSVLGDFAIVSGVYVLLCQAGPQFRPTGKYLHGVLLGAYPGFVHAFDLTGTNVWFATATAEVGYQWVFKSGFTLGLTGGVTGYFFYPLPGNPYKVNLSAHFGYAFKDPLFRAK